MIYTTRDIQYTWYTLHIVSEIRVKLSLCAISLMYLFVQIQCMLFLLIQVLNYKIPYNQLNNLKISLHSYFLTLNDWKSSLHLKYRCSGKEVRRSPLLIILMAWSLNFTRRVPPWSFLWIFWYLPNKFYTKH